jgi:peroxiredoxin Q/BCP
LFFYPRDESAGCTIEACAFRDSFDDLAAAGATVVGISSDSVASHARFASRHRLPFLLLADADGQVARAFGVRKFLGLLPGRETFVVDREGIVRGHLRSMSQPQRHVALARRVVARLKGRDLEDITCAP